MVSRFISSLLFLAAVNTGIAQAQVIPDGTLPTVVEQLENMRKITGGERVGNNLFHSFESFSILEGIEAIFENALEVENIFTRITGQDISIIDGLLQTAGGANFFLINPNGIVFGENASLDIGGSFIATTANSIEFADGTSFAASHPKVSLTISVPIGLGLDGNNGSITVNGSGEQITRQGRPGSSPYLRNRTSGLSVPRSETLALVGKEINFNGGVIVTEGGAIEIGSVDLGRVKIDENIDGGGWKLGYEEIQNFDNIDFSQNALIDPSGGNNSSVSVYGRDISLTNNSILLIQNNGTISGGKIEIEASELLEIRNQSNITSETLGQGDAPPISIVGKNLSIQDSGLVISNTFGLGRGGDIDISISEKLDITGSDSATNPAGISSFTANDGNAGNISISTQELFASQGSSISSPNIGNGKGGNINITSDLVELDGTTSENNIFTFIGSITFGRDNADAGNVNLEVSNLRILNGAAISSDSSSNASSGNISINAKESIELIGLEPSQLVPSSITSSVTVQESETLRSALGLPLIPEGQVGNITINTPILNISQGSLINVRNQGAGDGGTLTINADNLNLDTSGSITAASSSGTGGDIFLNSQNLEIGNDSQITAEANNDGDGGNITINTSNLIAKKNAQVTANAFNGRGGNITVNTQGLFLADPAEQVFNASSEFGLDGTITINSLENSFQQEVEESEIEIVTIPDFFTPRCANPDRAYLTLNPGQYLPENPDNYYSYPTQTLSESLISPELEAKLERLAQELESREEIETETEPESTLIWQPGEPIVNATEIVETEDGKVFLVPAEQKQERMQKLKCGKSGN